MHINAAVYGNVYGFQLNIKARLIYIMCFDVQMKTIHITIEFADIDKEKDT